MKHKKIKMFISFLLALVLLVSLPLDIQANAVALEGWILYAVITYLAAMGITFTVAGGVDAMVQAMEEKVKDYETQNNIIDFYEHFRNNNVRLVPSGGSDPEGNPFFDLFFTAGAVEAVQSFANWLTTNGGWSNGSTQTLNLSQATFSAYVDGDTVLTTSVVQDGVMIKQGSLLELDWNTSNTFVICPPMNLGEIRFRIDQSSGNYASVQIKKTSTGASNIWRGNSSSSYSRDLKTSYLGTSYKMTDIRALYFYGTSSNTSVNLGLLMDDGKCIPCTNDYLYVPDKVILTNTVDIMTPEELAEQFPSVNQGVSIKDAISVPMNDPSLDDWAQLVRDTFEDIGTIPQPVPQVVSNPDYVPPVTPAPSPEPSPEIEDIEDLGLPALGEAIKNKFPFCLPSDLRDLVGLLVAEPLTPKWEVDLYEWFDGKLAGDTTFSIDLAEYEVLGQISRWASVISFSIFLLLITKGMIGW